MNITTCRGHVNSRNRSVEIPQRLFPLIMYKEHHLNISVASFVDLDLADLVSSDAKWNSLTEWIEREDLGPTFSTDAY